MKYSIQEVAEAIGTSAETVRAGLIKGCFPFGCAYKKDGNSNYTYVLFPRKVEEYIGLGTDHDCKYVADDGLIYEREEN